MPLQIGSKVIFTGGYNQTEFKFNGIIEGFFTESRGGPEYIVWNILLETGSHHYSYEEQLKLI